MPGEAISGLDLGAGVYTVNLVTVVDDYHSFATGNSFIIVNKAPSSVSADNVTVTYGDAIVIGVTSVNATGVNYEVVDVNNVVVDSGVLNPGEAITGLDLAAGVYTVNLVTVVDGNHTSATGSSVLNVEEDVVLADLSVVKVLNKDTHDVGDIVHLTVTVTNHGPHHAQNVIVFLNIHDALEFHTSSIPKPLSSGLLRAENDPSYDHDSGFWNIGDLANGDSTQLYLTLKASAHGDYDLHSEVSSSTYDHNIDNNAHKVSLSVLKANEDNNGTEDDGGNNNTGDNNETDDGGNNETGDNNSTEGGENNNGTDIDNGIDDNDNPADEISTGSSDSSSANKLALDTYATGNPIAVLLLLMIAVLGVGIRRRH